MSADNWAVCPKCKIEIDAEADANIKVAQDAYGVASAEEYMTLLDEAKKPVIYGYSLREDYSIGVNTDATFEVSYVCNCEDCGFTYTFAFHEEIEKAAWTSQHATLSN